MKKIVMAVVVLGLVALVASPVLAQQQRGGFGGFGMGPAQLIGQKSVQEDLKLTDDQVKKVTEFVEKQRQNRPNFQGLSREEIQQRMRESQQAAEKALGEILKPDQLKRLKQIAFQVSTRQGLTFALMNPQNQEALQLNDEQKEALRAIGEDGRKFREELGLQFGQQPTEEQRKKMEDYRKGVDAKIEKLLTDDQKAKLKELRGEEFKGQIEQPRRPGGGGGARPPGGGRPPRP